MSDTVDIVKQYILSASILLTFEKGATAFPFLLGGRRCSRKCCKWVQLVRALYRAQKVGLAGVDGADNTGDRRRGAAEAVVHPGALIRAFDLALHLSGQVAVGAVVQALHLAGMDQRRAGACGPV